MYGAGFIHKIFEDPAAVDTDDVTDRTSRSEFIEGAISKIRFQNGQ